MAPAIPAPSQPRIPSSSVRQTGPITGRVTRLRAAKEGTGTPGLGTKPSGLLAKGKEGLRKVSDKIKEKEKEIQRARVPPTSENVSYSESLQVCICSIVQLS